MKLVPKSIHQLLAAMEDQLYLAASSSRAVASGDLAHIRDLATQLRALVCRSSNIDGLLWRMRDEFDVSDDILVRQPEPYSKLPIQKGAYLALHLADPEGVAPAGVPPKSYSLQKHIREHEAAYIDGQSVTQEWLINRVANEIGTAHEAHGVSPLVATLNLMILGGVQPYVPILLQTVRLVAHIGERVITAAALGGYRRRRPAYKPARAMAPLERTVSLPLDVPSLPTTTEGGAVVAIFGIPVGPDILSSDRPIIFPSIAQGAVKINAELTRKRRLRVSSVGLPLPYFGFEAVLDRAALTAPALLLIVSWSKMNVKAYVNGKQVSGSRDEA